MQRRRWFFRAAVLALAWCTALGCRHPKESPPEPAASASSSAAVATPTLAPVGSDGCLTTLDYLVPPARIGGSDLFRALVVDGDALYAGTMSELRRVSLADGKATTLGKIPGMTLSGRLVLFASGDRLLTQSSGEPIFMQMPKAGGAFQTFIDLTAAKRGGGRDAATRILQSIGKRSRAPRATFADFDGSAFYWAEVSAKGKSAAAHAEVRSVPLAGGEAKTLLEIEGDIDDVRRAGDRVVFMHTAPPSAAQLAEHAANKKKSPFLPEPSGEHHLMSVPLGGGNPVDLGRIMQMISHVVLLTDGATVFVTGYENEDLQKPGVYRVPAGGGGGLERIYAATVGTFGTGLTYGDRVVFAGNGQLEPGKGGVGKVVLTGPRGAGQLSRAACLPPGYTIHALAVSNKTLFLSLFESSSSLASIARIALP